jgi:hypothetical protein
MHFKFIQVEISTAESGKAWILCLVRSGSLSINWQHWLAGSSRLRTSVHFLCSFWSLTVMLSSNTRPTSQIIVHWIRLSLGSLVKKRTLAWNYQNKVPVQGVSYTVIRELSSLPDAHSVSSPATSRCEFNSDSQGGNSEYGGERFWHQGYE